MDIEHDMYETGSDGNAGAYIGLLSEIPPDDDWAWSEDNDDEGTDHYELIRRESQKWDDLVDTLGEFFDGVDVRVVQEVVDPELFKLAERYVEHRNLSKETEHLSSTSSRKRARL